MADFDDFDFFSASSSDISDDPAAGPETLSGLVEQIVFRNDENGYAVVRIDDDDGRPVTATGTLPYIAEGDRIRASGRWVTHKKYGRQFEIAYFERTLPVEEDDILRYLSSGAIKGIGPKTAAKIIEKFGTDSFEVIETHPEWLAGIPGISEKKAAQISENFIAVSGSREFLMFTRDFLSPATAMRIYKAWGAGASERIKRDPYSLCGEFGGIGFKRADMIAASLGMAPDAPERVKAGIKFVLSSEASRSGHTCLPLSTLEKCASELLFGDEDVSRGPAEETISEMCSDGRLVRYQRDGNDFIYLPQIFAAESGTARKLVNLSATCPAFEETDIASLIAGSEAAAGLKFAAQQKKALALALTSGVMILTGGPGTGKTTIIKGLIHIFERLDMTVCLAAPTGRAAKRMSEATAHEAKTIHRLLEMEFSDTDSARFLRNENDPLDEKVIIIDEASMIDVPLMNALVRSIRSGARLILIGDSDQLPSVGCGNVLGDVIDSGIFPVVTLTEIFRQSETSFITTNAHLINSGELPELSSVGSDFFFLSRDTDAAISGCVRDLVVRRLPKTYGDGIKEQIQVISPSRKGDAGTEALNESLRAALNPPDGKKKEFIRRGVVFREGDKIMQTKNDYSVEWTDPFDNTGYGVFTGDVGTLVSIDADSDEATVVFDERTCKYELSSFEEVDHAYAITVHKSQGSEYPVVIIPVYNCAPMLKTRNLLYTAITRASKMVILVGRRDVLAEMILNERRGLRCTMLGQMLREEAEFYG
ncbi:MAG: ATP-dependent RecD-like DNA helicase [Clostridia bacterium]|nr:ATP-dependent RecD-like DNA helicase [Clostridia bacterium]